MVAPMRVVHPRDRAGICISSEIQSGFQGSWVEKAMGATTMLHVRVDDEVKDQAAKAFERMGLTMSEGLRVFLRRVAADQALPFPLQVPNAATRGAMEEARAMSARFDTGEKLLDELSGNHR